MKFDRFRAYAAADKNRTVKAVKDGKLAKLRQTWSTEEIAHEGKSVSDQAVFDSGETVITRIVFYAGKPEEESVVGSVEVNRSGAFSEVCPDPETEITGEIIVSADGSTSIKLD